MNILCIQPRYGKILGGWYPAISQAEPFSAEQVKAVLANFQSLGWDIVRHKILQDNQTQSEADAEVMRINRAERMRGA